MSGPQRILFVEDEPDIQAVARIALERVGKFEISICGSGKEALERIGSFRPDLVLLDVMMPGMDGTETLKAIRKLPQHANLPVIFMTAKVQPTEIATYKSLGAWDVIPKPFDPMNLSSQIRKIWEEKSGK